jgi:biotin carboxylase
VRVLVTNTATAQAYAVVRALRPHAELIVATTSGRRPLGVWPNCHAAYSRLVDRRYAVPDPEKDWHEGRIQPENTAREQVFIDAVLEICRREKIDTVFPSSDDWVYVFCKNKSLFHERGILIPVPDYATLLKPLDKFTAIQCAREVGFPCPRTYLPESDEDVLRIARELEPPWVIKPRFTSGGRGLAVVNRVSELSDLTKVVRQSHGMPMIQEYIPGRRQNFYLVLDRDGNAQSVFTPKVLREFGRVTRSLTAACVTSQASPFAEQAVGVLRSIGWWGGATIQTKLDARDGQPKLMEINPRLGTHLWLRTAAGINEPLLCLQIARREPITAKRDYPIGCILLQPVEDAVNLPFELLDLLVYRLRTALLGRQAIDPSNPPMTLRQRFTNYREQYLGYKQRRFSPYFRFALKDPLPTLIWTSKLLKMGVVALQRNLGR